jgi:creatinine amidohydrolase
MRSSTKLSGYALALAALVSVATRADAQIFKLAEMNTEQIRALDRARTVIIMPGGILEEHGPYLPSYSDGYFNQRLAADLAAEIVKRPGWTVVMFPEIPLGVAGANAMGNKQVFPGSYTVRPATLRAVYMDLATDLGDQGFRWIFVVSQHGGPFHSTALDQAGDYFRDVYAGRMVHLGGILLSDWRPAGLIPSAVLDEDGFTVHSGLIESAAVMALRPDLVPETIKNAPSLTAQDFPSLIQIARRPTWPGYFGAPRHASAELGRKLLAAEIPVYLAVAMRILDGADERTMPRMSARRPPGIQVVIDSTEKRFADIEARQRAWLGRRAP